MDLPFDLEAEVAALIHNKLIELPTYPGVALKLQRLLSGGDYGLDSLSKLVQTDQALATNVMRAASSAFYRSSAPVSNLAAAIGRIGAKELCNIAIAGTLGLSANAEGPLVPLRREAWRSSLVCALMSQDLARGRGLEPGEAFLAGLLHDFGQTIALTTFEAILENHPATPPQDLAAWQRAADSFHVQLGATLASEWKLPAFVEQAVRHHATSTVEGPNEALVRLVGVAHEAAIKLLESTAGLGASALPGSTPEERARLEALAPRIPAFLQSFDDASPDLPPVPTASVTRVEASVLRDPVREVDFPCSVVKKGQAASYRATAWTTEAMRLSGVQPQPERHLVQLELPAGLKVCATVVSCAARDGQTVLEVKPFAMDAGAMQKWRALGVPHASAA